MIYFMWQHSLMMMREKVGFNEDDDTPFDLLFCHAIIYWTYGTLMMFTANVYGRSSSVQCQ